MRNRRSGKKGTNDRSISYVTLWLMQLLGKFSFCFNNNASCDENFPMHGESPPDTCTCFVLKGRDFKCMFSFEFYDYNRIYREKFI